MSIKKHPWMTQNEIKEAIAKHEATLEKLKRSPHLWCASTNATITIDAIIKLSPYLDKKGTK